MTDETAKAPCIVPRLAEGPFKWIWRELPEVKTLHLPVHEAKKVWEGSDGLSLMHHYVPGPESTMLWADYMPGWECSDFQGRPMRFGVVYTDERIPPADLTCGALPTATLLNRLFGNPNIQGVTYNLQADARVEAPEISLPDELVSRQIGMVSTGDPFAYQASHLAQAREAMAADRMHEAFYHIVEARTEGEALESVYPVEMHAVITLRMAQPAITRHDWYGETLRRRSPATDLYTAWLMILHGQSKEAFPLIQEHVRDETWAPMARLLGGRCVLAMGALPEALQWFDECLKVAPEHLEAILEKAVVLRNLHWQSNNLEGLGEARALLENLLPHTHFHKPQVLHHLATLAMAFEDTPKVEQYARESLALQNNPTVRRNLVLALLAQGRREEAAQQYKILQTYEPGEATHIAKHFTQPVG